MNSLYTEEAISKGGRSGTIKTPDGVPIVRLGNPFEKGADKHGSNPELLFAAAYSACFHDAFMKAAQKLGKTVTESMVRVLLSLMDDPSGGTRLAVEVRARLPGMSRTDTQRLMEAARQSCPYSKALRGDVSLSLMVDE
jgi:Ohr subfamily peroxiredoxin